jgi:hypothetical protein
MPRRHLTQEEADHRMAVHRSIEVVYHTPALYGLLKRADITISRPTKITYRACLADQVFDGETLLDVLEGILKFEARTVAVAS